MTAFLYQRSWIMTAGSWSGERQQAPRDVGGRDLPPGGPGEGGGPLDEVPGALRQHALLGVDVVLEADARVAAHADREIGHRELVAAHRGHRPGPLGREAVLE